MVGGIGLELNGAPDAKRRGRPKGAKGKRTLAIEAFASAVYGGSAATQGAAGCMVTRAELIAAKGNMAQAQVNKALDLVRRARDAQAQLAGDLKTLVVEAVAELAQDSPGQGGKDLAKLVERFMGRIKTAGGDLTIGQALKLLADQRDALMPYTDRKQPVAVDLVTNGPSVIVMGMDAPLASLPMMDDPDLDFIDVLPNPQGQVSQLKSRDEQQGFEFKEERPDPPAD